MSSVSPINVRIASKTRFFKTSGDSTYYYSSQLLSNLAFLKAVTALGQQLAWPLKASDRTPATKDGSSFLAKANLTVTGSRIQPLINLQSTPGKEWVSANLKIVDKLSRSQQFFNSKVIGLLAKTFGRNCRLDATYLLDAKESSQLPNAQNKTNKISKNGLEIKKGLAPKVQVALLPSGPHCFDSFTELGQIAKYLNKYNKRPMFSKYTTYKNQLPRSKNIFIQRKEAKQVFKTPSGLPFYLAVLGLVGHSQVLRSSLTLAPFLKGSPQIINNPLLIADHKKQMKTISSNGIGLVSSNPECYIGRSHKDMVLNFFFKIPAKFVADKKRTARPYKQVYITADLQGLPQSQKRTTKRLTYSSVRWV